MSKDLEQMDIAHRRKGKRMSEDWRNEFVTKGAAFKTVENKMESLLKQFGYDSYEEADEKTRLAYDGMMDALTAIYDMPPSAQPTEVQDILQYLDKYLHPIVSPEHWSVYSMLYDMVSMLLPEQPQQIKGRWIHDGYDIPHGVDWMHCSICGRREPYVPAAMTNFCPDCGAWMSGESEPEHTMEEFIYGQNLGNPEDGSL